MVRYRKYTVPKGLEMGEYDENQRFPKVTEVTKGAEGWLKIKDKEWMWRRTNCKAPPFD